MVFNADFSSVWRSVIPVITRMGCSIRTVDKDTGLVVFTKKLSPSEARLYSVVPSKSKLLKQKVLGGLLEVNALIEGLSKGRTRIYLMSSVKVTIKTIGSTSSQCLPSSGEFEKRFFYIISTLVEGRNYEYLFGRGN